MIKFTSIFVIGLALVAVAQAQLGFGARNAFGPGFGARSAFGPGFGARSAFGPLGPRAAFGPIGARGLVAPVIAATPVIAAPVVAAPIMPVAGFGRIGFGMPGIGPIAGVAAIPAVAIPRAVVVARPRVIVGRSVPEDFKLSFVPKFSQIELSFGVQRVACDVELRQVEMFKKGEFTLRSLESSVVDFQYFDALNKKSLPISVYWDAAITKPGLLVKSKLCFDAIFGTIKNEFKKAEFGMVVA